MSLRPAVGAAGVKPTPAQLADGESESKDALKREVKRQVAERLGWVAKARAQLTELEDRFLAEIADLPKVERQNRQSTFQESKGDRLAQLSELEAVQPTGVRLIGWAQIAAGVTSFEFAVGVVPVPEPGEYLLGIVALVSIGLMKVRTGIWRS